MPADAVRQARRRHPTAGSVVAAAVEPCSWHPRARLQRPSGSPPPQCRWPGCQLRVLLGGCLSGVGRQPARVLQALATRRLARAAVVSRRTADDGDRRLHDSRVRRVAAGLATPDRRPRPAAVRRIHGGGGDCRDRGRDHQRVRDGVPAPWLGERTATIGARRVGTPRRRTRSADARGRPALPFQQPPRPSTPGGKPRPAGRRHSSKR